jgi:pyruvate ferredoxin oxidoreductase gamma subunit
MFQIRIHGRGGQGVVSGAEMLSMAAFHEGRHAQAFPSFGSERMGAPVMAFCRMDDRPIRLREPVMVPDALIIQDPTLLQQQDVFHGLSRLGYMLINSSRTLEELGLGELKQRFRTERLCTVAATDLARQHLGKPLPNAALLGGFAALTREVRLESVIAAIHAKFSRRLAEGNAAAASAAFQAVAGARKLANA